MCQKTGISSFLHHLQESHQEGIWEDELLLATPEPYVYELLVLVDFNYIALAEFLMDYLTSCPDSVQAFPQFLFRLGVI